MPLKKVPVGLKMQIFQNKLEHYKTALEKHCTGVIFCPALKKKSNLRSRRRRTPFLAHSPIAL
jgi:hypothetical protein